MLSRFSILPLLLFACNSTVQSPYDPQRNAPALRAETGSCWVRLQRLDPAAIRVTRQAFLERNPGWDVMPTWSGMNQFTGLIESATFSRPVSEIGPPATLSADEYHRRRIEPLRRNADLIGIRRSDIDAIQWDKGDFQASSRSFEGPQVRGRFRRELPKIKHGEDARPGWELRVTFQRDGVVSRFDVVSWGPPVELCTRPIISEAQARATPDLFDPSARKNVQGMYANWPVTPREIVAARLGVHRAYDDTASVTNSTSVTYRLVWAIDGAGFTFFVDAAGGQLVNLQQNIIVD